jgi:D-glucosaminate-6-phosphate ammonia-lyase
MFVPVGLDQPVPHCPLSRGLSDSTAKGLFTMATAKLERASLFDRIGVRPVINACGIYTDLGGSRLSPGVWAAAAEMNGQFVRMTELLDKTGEQIARMLGAPAARVTPGAAAAIMLGTAAAMAGVDGRKSQQLPDTTGMPNEVLIQAGHRYKYDRQVTLTGATLHEIGSLNGSRPDQIEGALSSRTAMILHPAHLDGKPGTIALDQVGAIARKQGVPVFVDAAYMNYPIQLMGDYVRRGADLVAISAKYFGGPNAGGFIMGREDLVAAVSNVHFTRYESGRHLKFGRPLKMDRQTIVAVLVALEEWLAMDHEARFAGYIRQVSLLRDLLVVLPGLRLEAKCFTMDERFVDDPVNCLLVTFDKGKCGMSAAEVSARLESETPSVLAIHEGNSIGFVMDVLKDDEVVHIGNTVRKILADADAT